MTPPADDLADLPTVDLVGLAQGGRAEAREELFARYSERVHEIVRIRLGTRLRRSLESVDILQEATAEAVRSLDSFEMRDESSLIRWLAKIVENRIHSQAQRLGAAKRSAASEVPLQSMSEAATEGYEIPLVQPDLPGPLTEAGDAEQREVVRTCIESLPVRYRELILLRDYAGADWDAIAAEIGAKSADAARMMHARAVARLGGLLRERGIS